MTAFQNLGRRGFLAGAAAGAAALGAPAWAQPAKKMTDGVALIGLAERQSRLERAQALMSAAGLLGDRHRGRLVAWTTSPACSGAAASGRPMAIIPREGQILVVVAEVRGKPFREGLGVPAEVRTWEEDENPFAIAAGLAQGTASWPRARSAWKRRRAPSSSTGLAAVLPGAQVVSGAAIFRGCRMIKTPPNSP
jgi:Xaa-Pro dipeptidase